MTGSADVRLLYPSASIAAVVLLAVVAGACGGAAPPPAQEGDAGLQQAPETPTLETSTVAPDAQQAPVDVTPKKGSAECPNVDSLLLQVMQADDPVAAAEEHGLTVKGDKVQVVIKLTHTDPTVLEELEGVELGSQRDTEVQVFLPIDLVCRLGNNSNVVRVNALRSAIEQQ